MTTTARPTVSVIVTCWNLGMYLPDTLRSIRAQTFTDYELCVVDDGSTDAETLQVLSALPSDIIRVTTTNRGLPAARNAGVQHTTGTFICAVDADDILRPRLLEESVHRLEATPTLAFISHWIRAFGDESWDWCPDSCDLPGLLDINTVNGSALVRRTAVEAIGGWDETMTGGGEDWEFWIRMVSRGYCGAVIPEILFEYRRRPDSMSRLKFGRNGHAAVYRSIVERHPAVFREHWPVLAARRDADTAGHRLDIDALEEQLELNVEPAVRRAQDDLHEVRRRVSETERAARRDAEVERLTAAAEGLSTANDALRAELDGSTRALEEAHQRLRTLSSNERLLHTELTSLTSAHARAVAAIDALRTSWSWRLTGPLRAIGALAHWRGPRTRP